MSNEPDHIEKKEDLEKAVDRLQKAEDALKDGNATEKKAAEEIEEALVEIKKAEHPAAEYELVINRKPYRWPRKFIDGAEIKHLSGSPTDWVVNQIVSGPGSDPEIGDHQEVDLDHKAPPEGIKRFTTRKPKTSPGAWTP